MIVGMAGYAGAGKDTAAQCLVERGWRQDAFAAPLKAMALAIDPQIPKGFHPYSGTVSLSWLVQSNGWDAAKQNPEVRRFLQHLGGAVREHLGLGAWVEAMDKRRKSAGPGPCVITDVRYQNEAEWIITGLLHEGWPAVRREYRLIWIDRPGLGPVNDHPSDQGLVRDYCTHVVVNDGTPEQLWQRVLEVVGC